jgi:hypothetical protein
MDQLASAGLLFESFSGLTRHKVEAREPCVPAKSRRTGDRKMRVPSSSHTSGLRGRPLGEWVLDAPEAGAR